jgi:hypothetical protein
VKDIYNLRDDIIMFDERLQSLKKGTFNIMQRAISHPVLWRIPHLKF